MFILLYVYDYWFSRIFLFRINLINSIYLKNKNKIESQNSAYLIHQVNEKKIYET